MAFKFGRGLFLKIICGLVGVCFLVVAFVINRNLDENGEWMLKVDEYKVSSSEYLTILSSRIWDIVEQSRKRSYEDITSEEFKEIKVGSKDIFSFLEEGSKEQANNMLVYEKRFKDMGLSLTAKEKEEIKKQAGQMFLVCNEKFQGYNIGISKSACEDYLTHIEKMNKVVEETYKEGKPMAPTKEQLLDIAKNDMVKFIKVSVQKDHSEKKEEAEKDEEKEKNEISEISNKVEALLKEGKTAEDINKEFEEKKDGFAVKASSVFDFVKDEDVDSKKSMYMTKEDKEDKKTAKDMAEGEIKSVEREKGKVMLKKQNIEEKDLEGQKEALKRKYESKKEEEIFKAELEKSKKEENESAFKKYNPEKQIDLVFANKIEMDKPEFPFPFF